METRHTDHADWLTRLRERFVEVTTRRVDDSDIEDVVQEALRIVAEKHIRPNVALIDELPRIAWCFQVLRNVIGNHYRREEVRKRRMQQPGGHEGSTPARFAEELESRDNLRLIEDAISEMHNNNENCGRYLARLIDGDTPQDVANEEDLAPAVFYRRLYRCRQKLRALLSVRGVNL